MPVSSLPRELLKWLQSLDLSYPIKNPRRDFSNGYLIAEIFSRYYPDEPLLLDVRTFYTAEGTDRKERNWDQLQKFFKKAGIPIPQSTIHPLITCQPYAAHLFLTSIYTILTGKTIKSPILDQIDSSPITLSSDTIPGFQLPTTSNLIKNVAGESVPKAQAILDAHTEYLKYLRAHRPTYHPKSYPHPDQTATASTTTDPYTAQHTHLTTASDQSDTALRIGSAKMSHVQMITVHQNAA